MVKIKDIAAKSGLSIATVSKALSGKPDINPKTIEYVQNLAKEMGYIPNASARMLKTNHSYSIGVLFRDATSSGLTHEYFSGILNSIRDECERYGYDITFISNHVGNDNLTYYQNAKYRNFDGVIIASVDYKNKEVEELVESEIPTITIDYDFNDRSSINSDNLQGMHDIIQYVSSMGHKKIGFIHGELTSVTQKRITGFYRACEQFGIKVDERYIREGLYHVPSASAKITREFLAMEDRPTCILFPDDYSLLGGITMIEKNGLKVPDDISVVGYDGIQISRLMRPEFTTYVQNVEQIGVEAVRKLMEIIENPKTSLPERISVKGHLQEGSTVLNIKKKKQ